MEFFYIPVPTISNFYKSVKIALFLKFLKLSSIIFMRISQTMVFTWMFLSTKVPPNLLCLVEAIVLAFILLFSSSVSVLAFSASTTRFLQGERRRPRDPGEQRRQGIVFDVSFSLRSFGGDVGERGRLEVLKGGHGRGGQRRRAAAAGAGRRPQRRHVRARR